MMTRSCCSASVAYPRSCRLTRWHPGLRKAYAELARNGREADPWVVLDATLGRRVRIMAMTGEGSIGAILMVKDPEIFDRVSLGVT